METDLPADLPLLLLDASLVEQVCVNLLENAAKYTPAGSRVRVAARREASEVEVEVADDGPGLKPGDEQRVFDKFFRDAGAARGGLRAGARHLPRHRAGARRPHLGGEPAAAGRRLPLHPARGRGARRARRGGGR